MKTQIIFLGTGANGGTPQLDCRCFNCSKNVMKRKRSSILVKHKNMNLVIDCGPDFKQQLFDQNLRLQDISGIVLSHLHPDHSAGLTELCSGKKLNVPIIVSQKIKKQFVKESFFNHLIKSNFACFKKRIERFNIKLIEISHAPNFPTCAIKLTIGGKIILIATDIAKISSNFIKESRNANIIIFDGTFLEEDRHYHIAIKHSAPSLHKLNRNIIFTHVNHSEDNKSINNFLKKFNFKLAFDGMAITI